MSRAAIQPSLVTTADALAEAVVEARTFGRVGLDTEFLREKTYRSRVCLVQIATEASIWLIDPLTSIDLKDVADLLADPDVRIIVHAGRQDFELFHDSWRVAPSNVFDVQIGAGFAGFGASLPYGRLVENVLGVALTKGEAYTDWCRRPLTDAQTRYAADDVRFLLDVESRLRAKLEELGRWSWATEEMRALEDPASYTLDPAEVWRKVAGRGSLTPRQTAVLREVARWRESVAASRDIPRGWVVKDPTLVEIARRAPTNVSQLRGIRGLHPKEIERSGRAIVEAVRVGTSSTRVAMDPSPPRSALARGRALSGVADALVRTRCDAAGIATELVATRGELEGLIADATAGEVDHSRHRLLRGWRRELAGDAVLRLIEGRIGIRATRDPPYIEEVPTT